MTWELASSKWEDPSAPPDIAQRLTFACHIRFDSDAAFDAITDESDTISDSRRLRRAYRPQRLWS